MVQKIETNARIPKCPDCEERPNLERNAGGRFRVKCPNCKNGTDWVNKTEALLQWSCYCVDSLTRKIWNLEYKISVHEHTIKSLNDELKTYKF